MLVQAARRFFKKMVKVLEKKMNFVWSVNDQCLLMRNDQNRIVIICLYIDETFYIGDKKAIDIFKKEIKEHFVTKTEGKVDDYVGSMIKRINSGILLYQSDLIKKIELQFEQEIKDIQDYRTPGAPGEGSIQVKDDDVCISEKEQFKYRSAVGMMLFLVKYSRPNTSNTVRELSKSNSKANYAHYKQMLRAVNNVLKNQKSNVEVYAYFRKGSVGIQMYV